VRRIAGLAAATVVVALAATCGSAPDPGGDARADSRPEPTLVPHGRLADLMPAADGWERGPVRSAHVGAPAPSAHASAGYARGAARVEMEITDTAGQADYLEATQKIAGTSFERTSANGYIRGATIGGAPAIESWNHVDGLGEITVLVGGRFVVHASGSGIDDLETLRAFVDAVPFDRLAALAPR
jgi:hypothetical protein